MKEEAEKMIKYLYKKIKVFCKYGKTCEGNCVGFGTAEDYGLDSDVLEIDTDDGQHLGIEEADIDHIEVLKDDGTYDKVFGTTK